uniref:Nuclear receptor domain-containing protein n=1 Tax=Heterorhabditis bacteriophora TaxID=37862 RepID=A0A1I7WNR5_HETBA
MIMLNLNFRFETVSGGDSMLTSGSPRSDNLDIDVTGLDHDPLFFIYLMIPDLIAFLRLNHAKELALASAAANDPDSNVSPTNYDLCKNGKVIKRCKEDIVTGPCSVCEAPNSGFHFGAMACAACSAFFRRTIAEKRKYVCRKEGDAHLNCPIDQQHRCYCRACRLQKCLVMGMDPCGVQPHRDSIGAKPQKRRKEVTDSLLKLAENATTVDSPTSTRFLDDTLADHLGKKSDFICLHLGVSCLC